MSLLYIILISFIADTTGIPVNVIRENELGRYDTLMDTLTYAQEYAGVIHVMNKSKNEYSLRPPKEFYRKVELKPSRQSRLIQEIDSLNEVINQHGSTKEYR